MADPTQRSTGSKPKTRGEDQPKDSSKNSSVVKLSYTRNNQAQDASQDRITHFVLTLQLYANTKAARDLFGS